MVARAIAITTATSTTEHEPVNDTSKFEMAMRTSLLEARRAAAAYLVSVGRSDDARVVSNGGGDDFLEVRVALQAIGATVEQVGRLERALACYADQTFWDGDIPEASLAFHDGGDIARSALNGKELYALHRD